MSVKTTSGAILIGGAPFSGIASGCPYCLAKQDPWPAVGTSLRFLRGSDAGWSGSVVEDKWGNCPSDRFLVQMEYEKRSTTMRTVMPSRDLYLASTLFSVPDWMPPLSIDDNAALHENLMGVLPHVVIGAHEFSAKLDSFWKVVSICWWLRLPLQRSDVWPMLQAHGVSHRQRSRILDYFDFGLNLLTMTHGRPAIRKKRMTPMSRGRYLTKRQRELNVQIFGRE